MMDGLVAPPTRRVARLHFVFDANAGLIAGMFDSAKKVLSLNGCALCSITHGIAGEKSEWRSCRDALGVNVEYVHRDELAGRLRDEAEDHLPCVVAEDESGGLTRVLESDVLERCEGSVDALRGRLLFHLARQDLSLE